MSSASSSTAASPQSSRSSTTSKASAASATHPPTSSSNSPTASHLDSNVSTIAVAVDVPVVVVLIASGLCLWWWRRRKRVGQQDQREGVGTSYTPVGASDAWEHPSKQASVSPEMIGTTGFTRKGDVSIRVGEYSSPAPVAGTHIVVIQVNAHCRCYCSTLR